MVLPQASSAQALVILSAVIFPPPVYYLYLYRLSNCALLVARESARL
jgi:hypothetical protein